MIVLDEQLQGLGLEDTLAGWYLRQLTFVTINYTDFWRRVPADKSYCIVCMELPVEQTDKASGWLRQLFRLPEFKTKGARMGTVVLASPQQLRYYRTHAQHIHLLRWPD